MQDKKQPIQTDHQHPAAETPLESSEEISAAEISATDALEAPKDSADAPESDKSTGEAAQVEESESVPADDGSEADDSSVTDDGDADEETVEEETYEDDPDFRAVLEALIFASDEPLTFRQIKDIVAPETASESAGDDEAPGRKKRRKKSFTITRVKRAIDVLNDTYAEQGRSFRIVEVAGGFAFQTTKDYGVWVGKLFTERSRRRLTQSALETLSIIAFRQPISKPAVEAIRGVNAEYVVKSLLERNLISIVGREDSPGRPLLYGTTKTFLKHFGLSSINDLPKPREIKDLLASEDDLGSNPIEEMDPMKAAELTRVSSQELERLFENAQLKNDPETTTGDEGDAAPAEPGDTVPPEVPGNKAADEAPVHDETLQTEAAEDAREDGSHAGTGAPVLHVQFDGSGAETPEAMEEAGDDTMNDDDLGNDETIPDADEDASMENPFDDEVPDADEKI